MPEIKGTHSAQIEREQRGYQWIRSGVPGKNVAPPPQIKNWSITQQEQPDHPLPRVSAGKQGPNVAPPPQIKTWSVTVQEWPDHPQPYVRRGVAIPNVAAPPQIGAARTVQEWPDERQAFVRRGVAIPNVAAPPQVRSTAITVEERPLELQAVVRGPYFAIVTAPPPGFVRTTQEQPDHLLPKTGTGVQGPNVRPPIRDWTVTVQEAPDEKQARLGAGVQGPDVAAPPQVKSTAITIEERPPDIQAVVRGPYLATIVVTATPQGYARTVQELPDHPLPNVSAGVQGPNVTPPQASGGTALRGTHSALIEREARGYQWIVSGVPGPNVVPPPPPQIGIVTRQEQPDHPGPFLWKHFTVAPPITIPRGIGLALTTQEQPYHPFGGTLIAIQGPNVGPPVTQSASTKQEAPDEKQAFVRPGVPGQNVAPQPQIKSYAATVQEWPDEKQAFRWTHFTLPPPLTATPQGRAVTTQEQPDHPLPKTGIGIQGPNVGPPVTRTAIIGQEWPDERQARVWAGIQGPNVAPPITRTAITQQEQPDHPLPRVRTGIQGPNVASGIGAIFTKQEQPDHPGPFFVGFQFPPPVIVTAKPETRIVITRQEWPDSPPNPGYTWPGTPPIFVPPPPFTAPPPGGGKRKKNRGMPPYVPPLRLMTQGDVARAKIAAKMRKKDISEEEMLFLLSLLDDED